MSAGHELQQSIRKILQKNKNMIFTVLLSQNIGLAAVRVTVKSCLVLCKCNFLHTLITEEQAERVVQSDLQECPQLMSCCFNSLQCLFCLEACSQIQNRTRSSIEFSH